MLRCMSPIVALFGHGAMSDMSPLSAPKRTSAAAPSLWVHALVFPEFVQHKPRDRPDDSANHRSGKGTDHSTYTLRDQFHESINKLRYRAVVRLTALCDFLLERLNGVLGLLAFFGCRAFRDFGHLRKKHVELPRGYPGIYRGTSATSDSYTGSRNVTYLNPIACIVCHTALRLCLQLRRTAKRQKLCRK
jgi:hypothetical protein